MIGSLLKVQNLGLKGKRKSDRVDLLNIIDCFVQKENECNNLDTALNVYSSRIAWY